MSDKSGEPPAVGTAAEPAGPAPCPRCHKPAALCICDTIVPIENTIALLVLQHPQEQDKGLGTARLTALHLANAAFKIGLSWPSLAKALGRPADPQRWATLYLGSADPAALAPGNEIILLDAKGRLLPDQEAAMDGIEGIIVLDGTWSQAKTLWWRNPWLLKSRRVVLGPKRKSRYGALRKEPRPESLATIEAVALLLSRLEGKPEIESALGASFSRMLDRYRAWRPPAGEKPHAVDRRRRVGRRGRAYTRA